jgi:hypothetical protein
MGLLAQYNTLFQVGSRASQIVPLIQDSGQVGMNMTQSRQRFWVVVEVVVNRMAAQLGGLP